MSSVRWQWIVAMAVQAALIFGACGGGGGSGDDDDDADADVADAAPDTADADTRDIADRLKDVPGLSVSEEETSIEGYRLFYGTFEQPADHAQPDGLKFQQRLWILHKDVHAPTVQFTSGYSLPGIGRTELTRLLSGNQVAIEHRFFVSSRPEPADWSLLTIEQSAKDFHRINAALKPIYDGSWLMTGASKGGMTSVFYRRFFPDDVDATVAYVAPIPGANDERFGSFLAEVGDDPACNAALDAFAAQAVTASAQILPLVTTLATNESLTFDKLGQAKALEHAIIEAPFAMWQYRSAQTCASVPGANATAQELFDFLQGVNGVDQYSDADVDFYAPYYWQAGLQLGWPKVPEPVGVSFPGTDVPASYAQPVVGEAPVFDADANADIAAWVDAQGERLLFIYGENDPWTAAKYVLGGAEDSLLLTVPKGNHGARITQLAQGDRDAAFAALERWTGVKPVVPMMKAGRAAEPADPMDTQPRMRR